MSLPILQTLYNDIYAAQNFISQKLTNVEPLAAETVKGLISEHIGLGKALNFVVNAANWLQAGNTGAGVPVSFRTPAAPSNSSAPNPDSDSSASVTVPVVSDTEVTNG